MFDNLTLKYRLFDPSNSMLMKFEDTIQIEYQKNKIDQKYFSMKV
jgi:hypothetical protein